jgi:hypothetical protein
MPNRALQLGAAASELHQRVAAVSATQMLSGGVNIRPIVGID